MGTRLDTVVDTSPTSWRRPPRRRVNAGVPESQMSRQVVEDLDASRGGLLLVDATCRAASLDVAVWGVVVDAIDVLAARFYEHFGFVPLLDTADRLVLPIATFLRTRP